MMTTNPDDIATEDSVIAKSSVAISSAHRDDDGGNDDDDDDCLHFLEGLAHIWLVTQTPLTDTAPLAQYHHPRHHSNIHHRHPRHPCLTD